MRWFRQILFRYRLRSITGRMYRELRKAGMNRQEAYETIAQLLLDHSNRLRQDDHA